MISFKKISIIAGIFLLSCSNAEIETNEATVNLLFENNTPMEIGELIKSNKNVFVLDVRSEHEYKDPNTDSQSANGHRLKGAVNIPVNELESRLEEIQDYKTEDIIVYCSHAIRSARSSKILAENGFTKVHNMLGGLSTWLYTDPSFIPMKDELLIRNK